MWFCWHFAVHPAWVGNTGRKMLQFRSTNRNIVVSISPSILAHTHRLALRSSRFQYHAGATHTRIRYSIRLEESLSRGRFQRWWIFSPPIPVWVFLQNFNAAACVQRRSEYVVPSCASGCSAYLPTESELSSGEYEVDVFRCASLLALANSTDRIISENPRIKCIHKWKSHWQNRKGRNQSPRQSHWSRQAVQNQQRGAEDLPLLECVSKRINPRKNRRKMQIVKKTKRKTGSRCRI